MATPYRTSRPAPGLAFKRWQLLLLFFVAVIVGVFFIAGPIGADVLTNLYFAVLMIPLIVPAAILGVVLTAPLERAKVFERSPWPDAFRLAVGTALGLGVMSIGTMLLGEARLLHHSIPLVLPAIALGVGLVPARNFIKKFNFAPLRAPADRADLLLLLAAIPAAVMLIACSFPPATFWVSEAYGYDVSAYHLQAPREYLANNSLAPLHHNVYSYLPANVEMLYLQLMSFTHLVEVQPDGYLAIYPAQYLHTAIMMLAGVIVFLAPLTISRVGRILALLAFAGTPWVLITGSLAYNEGGMMLYGALAMALAFAAPSRAATITIGVALGLAVGCKLTAGTMFAIPVAVVMIMQRRPVPMLLAAGIALAVYAPWAVRAAADSGNPVFPMATSLFGTGHLSPAQAKRWDVAHAAPAHFASVGGRFQSLGREALLEPYWSYLPVGPSAFRKATSMADEPRSVRLAPGPLWIAAIIALLLAATRGPQAWLLLVVLVLQIIFWLAVTHLEARFFMPTLVPLAWIIGIGAAALPAPRLIITVLVGAHCLVDALLLIPEKGLFLGAPKNAILPIGETLRIDTSPPEGITEPPDRNAVYLLGDATPLIYPRPVYYYTVFDENPLLAVLRKDGAEVAMKFLADKKVRYLGINRNEIFRFASTYGFEPGQKALRDPDDLKAYAADVTEMLSRLVDAKIWRDGKMVDIPFPLAQQLSLLLEFPENFAALKTPPLGLTFEPLTKESAAKLGAPATGGIIIRSVAAESPAAQAGLKAGDVLFRLMIPVKDAGGPGTQMYYIPIK